MFFRENREKSRVVPAQCVFKRGLMLEQDKYLEYYDWVGKKVCFKILSMWIWHQCCHGLNAFVLSTIEFSSLSHFTVCLKHCTMKEWCATVSSGDRISTSFLVQIILIALEENIYFNFGNDMFNFDFCQIALGNRQIKQGPVCDKHSHPNLYQPLHE